MPRTDDNESVEGGVRGKFATGPISHEFNVGGSSMQSVYFSDTLSAFDDRVQIIAGGREQYIKVVGYSYTNGLQDSRYDKSDLTPVVGLVYKPTAETSVYFNRIEGLAEGPAAPSTVINANQIFSPYTSVRYETGTKYEAGSFSATLALYQIEQPSAYTNAADYYVVDGNQRNRGIEFNVSGEPLPGLRMIGGGAYIKPASKARRAGRWTARKRSGFPPTRSTPMSNMTCR